MNHKDATTPGGEWWVVGQMEWRARHAASRSHAFSREDKWLALAIIINELGKDEDDDNNGDENDGETSFICHHAPYLSPTPAIA